MSLEITINDQIKDAMRAKDKDRLNALRAIKSALLLAATEKGAGDQVSEDAEMKILLKLQKQRKDSIEIFTQQGREELAAEDIAQLSVIEEFLPKPLTEEELSALIKGMIEEVGASSSADFGKVMGIASKQLSGRADGKLISAKVKELLG